MPSRKISGKFEMESHGFWFWSCRKTPPASLLGSSSFLMHYAKGSSDRNICFWRVPSGDKSKRDMNPRFQDYFQMKITLYAHDISFFSYGGTSTTRWFDIWFLNWLSVGPWISCLFLQLQMVESGSPDMRKAQVPLDSTVHMPISIETIFKTFL